MNAPTSANQQTQDTANSGTGATVAPDQRIVSTLLEFSRLVADSLTSEDIYALLGRTIVDECKALRSVVFGTTETGSFRILASYGACAFDPETLGLDGMGSVAELCAAAAESCERLDYRVRATPLIGDANLFGVLLVVYSEADPFTESQWMFVNALTELTAISLNKTYQHRKLQQSYDDLRASQDALVRTEKLHALGQMSAGVAHDLRNLLNPLVLYTDHLLDAAESPGEVTEIAKRMERVLTRGLETVERLRDFSRQAPEENESTPTDLNAIGREASEIGRTHLGKIRLAVDLGAPPLCLIRPGDGVNAVLNLLLNAADALQGQGTIHMTTGAADNGAWLEVADDGPGMEPEVRRRILEPFFTTKGKIGTGLGVSIVYAFTQRHGGSLEIESEPGQGARFRMWFPAFVP